MNQRNIQGAEYKAVDGYKGSDYRAMNLALRTATPMDATNFNLCEGMDTASKAATFPEDVVMYRGVKDYKEMKIDNPATMGKTTPGYVDNGFMSASFSKRFAADWASGETHQVMLELKVKAGTKGVHIGQVRGYSDSEQEVVFPRGTFWKVVGFRNEKIGSDNYPILTMETLK